MSLPSPSPQESSTAPDVAQVVDHLFRREAGRLVAILAARFGSAHLHLAEDVVQDALLRAMQVWPYSGVPENPSAWLLQTARNRALDITRRATLWREKQDTIIPLVEESLDDAVALPAPQFEDEIRDSQLRLMFACCQPTLPTEAQVALVLKTLGGFGEKEIAAAFLTSTDAVAKRLVRARQHLRESGASLELPRAEELAPRLSSVLQSLYLLFNEGYKASHGDSLLRADLCAEAIRLGELLTAHPLGRRPETQALLALMHLHASRLPARVADDGSLLVLSAQDRSRWDKEQIRRGLAYLDASAEGTQVSRYHLEAGIAAAHALAPTPAETQWAHILDLYDALLVLAPSPVIALNRAVALSQVNGPVAALAALDAIPRRPSLDQYHLYHAVKGQLLADTGRKAEAAAALQRALDLAPQPAERALLAQKLAQLAAD